MKKIFLILAVLVLWPLIKCTGAAGSRPKSEPARATVTDWRSMPSADVVRNRNERPQASEAYANQTRAFGYCYELVGTDVHVMGTDPNSNRSRTTKEYGEEFDRCIAAQRAKP